MSRKTTSRKTITTADAFPAIATMIAQDVAHYQTLQERLDWLADLLSHQLTGVRGIGICAFCKEEIISYALSDIRLPDNHPPYLSLAKIRKTSEADRQLGAWTPLSRHHIQADHTNEGAYVGRIGSKAEPSGMILVVTNEEGRAATLDTLKRLGGHVAWVVRESSVRHFTALNAKLQSLAFKELASMKYNPDRIITKLSRIFKADPATIFIRDMDRLFVSATTDEKLDLGATNYEGKYLVDYIFKTEKAFILDDGSDPREMLRKTGVNKEHLLYNESVSQRQPLRFLGVPIVFKGKVRGVIRLLRKQTSAPFCISEKEALVRFSEIFGAHNFVTWRMLLSDRLMNSATDGVCVSRVLDDGGRKIPQIIFANASAEEIFEKERGDLIGMDGWDLYVPSERERVRDELDSAIQAGKLEVGPIKTKILCQEEIQKMADVSYRFVESLHFWPDAKITIALIRDVTDKHRKEEQHRRLLELLAKKGLAYFRADIDGRTLETSKADESITGYSESQLLGLDRRELYQNSKDRDTLFRRASEAGGLVHTIEQLKRKDGEPFYAEGDVRILHDEETGERDGFEGLYSDVTDRVSLQEFIDVGHNRILTESELLESLREYAKFHQSYIAGLGHQLRTPLGSLVENLVNLKKGVIGLNRLDYAIGEARACALLAKNLTYIDKILRDEKIDFARTSFAKLIVETVIDFDHRYKERGLKIDINRGGLDYFFDDIYGHRELLRQVAVVLIDNAIKYSFEGSKINIDAKSWSPGNRVFEVYNSGIPIAVDIQEKVFERGYRSRLAKDWVPHGTGMGLWLAKKIVEAHGAEIQCRGKVLGKEKKTVFRVIWPNSRGAR